MSYPALPDRRVAYDDDGTVAFYGKTTGLDAEISSADLIELNDVDSDGVGPSKANYESWTPRLTFIFPELRVIAGLEAIFLDDYGGNITALAIAGMEGSPDTTNGSDGTWTAFTFGSGLPVASLDTDTWRAHVAPCSIADPVRAVRITAAVTGHGCRYARFHLYGHKAPGETPDDLVFLDYDEGGAEFVRDEDFADSPRGTTSLRTFKVKNTSATLTANTITLNLDDADFVLSTSDEGPWSSSLLISALGPGVSSGVFYVRHTTPAPGVGILGPRYTRITATAASWS